MVYNTTALNNLTNINDVLTATNTYLTEGVFAAGILLVLGIIIFASMKNYDTKVTMITTGFILSIIAIFFYGIGWIEVYILTIPLILLLSSVFYAVASK